MSPSLPPRGPVLVLQFLRLEEPARTSSALGAARRLWPGRQVHLLATPETTQTVVALADRTVVALPGWRGAWHTIRRLRRQAYQGALIAYDRPAGQLKLDLAALACAAPEMAQVIPGARARRLTRSRLAAGALLKLCQATALVAFGGAAAAAVLLLLSVERLLGIPRRGSDGLSAGCCRTRGERCASA